MARAACWQAAGHETGRARLTAEPSFDKSAKKDGSAGSPYQEQRTDEDFHLAVLAPLQTHPVARSPGKLPAAKGEQLTGRIPWFRPVLAFAVFLNFVMHPCATILLWPQQ